MIEIAIWIFIGIFIGTTFGVLIMSLLTSGRMEEKDYVIEDLRLQRRLLKEEIKKLSKRRKPIPRQKRNKNG
jgi:hypothetical protein|tara:strand:+ start:267 stop:482 length:216 start_codon:yes stop_codon:yes gene_type:complete